MNANTKLLKVLMHVMRETTEKALEVWTVKQLIGKKRGNGVSFMSMHKQNWRMLRSEPGSNQAAGTS